MKVENMVYNYEEIKNAIKKVNNLAITADKKIYHKTLLYNFKIFIDNELYDINTFTFNTDYMTEYQEYKNNVNLYYDETKKSILDKNIERLKNHLLRELKSILNLGNEYLI